MAEVIRIFSRGRGYGSCVGHARIGSLAQRDLMVNTYLSIDRCGSVALDGEGNHHALRRLVRELVCLTSGPA
jgi:hypothetical protein